MILEHDRLPRKQMTLDIIEEVRGWSEKQLIDDGWEEAYSFHGNDPEQWNMACDEVRGLRISGIWDVILVNPDDEKWKADHVQLIFKKRRSVPREADLSR